MISPPMTLVCHTQAGGIAGMGHLARCSAICEAAVDRGWLVVLVVENADGNDLLSYLDRRLSAIVVAGHSEARTQVRSAVTEPSSGRSVLLVDFVDPLLTVNHPDRKLFDIVIAMHGPQQGLSADFVVNQDSFPNSGPGDYHLKALRRAVRVLRPFGPWQGNSVQDVLISFGASDPGRQTESFLLELINHKLEQRLSLILGSLFDENRKHLIAELADATGTYLLTQSDIAGAIASTDLMVTLGGQTSYEAMHLGRPVAVIEWAHLATSAASLCADGLAVPLGTLPGAVTRLADLVYEIDVLHTTARCGWETIDGMGARRVLDVMAELLPHSP